MAMPPYVRHPGLDEIVEFYGAAAAAAGVPAWIQDYVAPMGTPMAPACWRSCCARSRASST